MCISVAGSIATGWQKMAFLRHDITVIFSMWASLLYVALMSLPLVAEAPKRSQYIWNTGGLPVFSSWDDSIFPPWLLAITYSLSCRYKPVWLSFFCRSRTNTKRDFFGKNWPKKPKSTELFVQTFPSWKCHRELRFSMTQNFGTWCTLMWLFFFWSFLDLDTTSLSLILERSR